MQSGADFGMPDTELCKEQRGDVWDLSSAGTRV